MSYDTEKNSLFLNSDDSMSDSTSNINKNQRMLINPTTGNLEPMNNLLHNHQEAFKSIEEVIGNANVEQTGNSGNMGDRIFENNGEDDGNVDSSDASSSLLMGTRSIPQVCIQYKKAKYGLFSNVPVSKDSDSTLQHLSIRTEISFEPINAIFKIIRESLQLYSPSTELSNSEITLNAVELDLELQEDNMYNKNITLQDIVSIYRSLRDNSSSINDDEEESLVLTFDVTTRKRFLSRYNELVELVDNHGNLSHIFKFSNSSGNPVVLDDNDDNQYEGIDRRIINQNLTSANDDSDIEIID